MTFLRGLRPTLLATTASLLVLLFGTLPTHGALYVTSDRTISGGNPINSSEFGIYIGRDAVNNRYTGVDADLVGATDSWNLETLSDSVVSIRNNTYIEQMYAQEDSTVTVNSAIINNGITVNGHANLTILGVLTTSIGIYSDAPMLPGDKRATANISGGTFNNAATVTGYGVLNLSGGSFGNAVIGFNNAEITFGGTASTLHMYAYDNSHITVTGGTIGDVRVIGNGVVDVYGGVISPNTVYGLSPTALVNFYGTNLQYSNPTAGTFGGNDGYYWDLTGTLQNGDLLSTRLFEQGGTGNAPSTIQFNPNVTAVPEAGTGILWACGMFPIATIVLRRRR